MLIDRQKWLTGVPTQTYLHDEGVGTYGEIVATVRPSQKRPEVKTRSQITKTSSFFY
jgi:hypothetical protein